MLIILGINTVRNSWFYSPRMNIIVEAPKGVESLQTFSGTGLFRSRPNVILTEHGASGPAVVVGTLLVVNPCSTCAPHIHRILIMLLFQNWAEKSKLGMDVAAKIHTGADNTKGGMICCLWWDLLSQLQCNWRGVLDHIGCQNPKHIQLQHLHSDRGGVVTSEFQIQWNPLHGLQTHSGFSWSESSAFLQSAQKSFAFVCLRAHALRTLTAPSGESSCAWVSRLSSRRV